jgi:hypothetical protein
VGPLFNIALVFIASAFVVGITFLVFRLLGRTLPEAVLGSVAFCLGALCAAAAAGLVGVLLMGPGAVLQSRGQVVTYLGCLAVAATVGGVGFVTLLARGSNNRWRGP